MNLFLIKDWAELGEFGCLVEFWWPRLMLANSICCYLSKCHCISAFRNITHLLIPVVSNGFRARGMNMMKKLWFRLVSIYEPDNAR